MRSLPPRVMMWLAMSALPIAALGVVSTNVRAQLARPQLEIVEGPPVSSTSAGKPPGGAGYRWTVLSRIQWVGAT
jgi:hypothetical protein